MRMNLRRSFPGLSIVTLLVGLLGCGGGSGKDSAAPEPPIPPSILTQPMDQKVAAPSTATFSLAASGTSPLNYQWRRDDMEIKGATSATYTTPPTTLADNGSQFQARASNSAGQILSRAATLTVEKAPQAPIVTLHPISQSVLEGESATFSVEASGEPSPSFQWERWTPSAPSWSLLPGATSSTWTTAKLSPSDHACQFRVQASNALGEVFSDPAMLSVEWVRILEQPKSQLASVTGEVRFRIQVEGNPSPTYQWEQLEPGQSTWKPIPDATGPELVLQNLPLSAHETQFQCWVQAGRTLAKSTSAVLNVKAAPMFLAYGWNRVFRMGSHVRIEPPIQGIVTFCHWSKNGTLLPHANSPYLDLGPLSQEDVGTYSLMIGNAWGTDSRSFNVEVTQCFTRLAAGPSVSAYLDEQGQAWIWGELKSGLGDGLNHRSLIPVKAKGLSGAAALSAGGEHLLALGSDGTVWAWGNNTWGQVGNASTQAQSFPLPIQGLSSVRSIHAGEASSLALMMDGTVQQWGRTSRGPLLRPEPVPGLKGIVSLAQASHFALALDEEGRVWAWGTPYADHPQPIPELENIVAIAAGRNHALALDQDKKVWTWGEGSRGQLGHGTWVDQWKPQVSKLSYYSYNYIQVGAAGEVSVAITRGSVVPWGANHWGQLGFKKTTEDQPKYKGAITLTGFQAFAQGESHALALLADGSLKAWGRSAEGQLGLEAKQLSPLQVPGLSGVVGIAAARETSAAVLADGSLQMWGKGGPRGAEIVPKEVSSVSEATRISIGGEDSFLALLKNGTIMGWGYLSGNGTTDDLPTPALVPDLDRVIGIWAGHRYALVSQSDGSPWAWGRNAEGLLGDGSTVDSWSPQPIADLRNIVSLQAGPHHALALNLEGQLFSWGRNDHGQLGHDSGAQQLKPLPLAGLPPLVGISAGEGHSLALKQDGHVLAWGSNAQGQLGDGSLLTRPRPGIVAGLSGVAQVLAAGQHSLARTAQGSVWAWGSNEQGCLGDGSEQSRLTPVPISGLGDVLDIAAGKAHGLALKKDGTVWAWGSNQQGALGLPDIGFSLQPRILSGITLVGQGQFPVLLQHPQSLTVNRGQSASFSVKATGSATFTYQWRKNGLPIPQAAQAQWRIEAVEPSDEARYDVQVSNALGQVLSQAATLRVEKPPLDLKIQGAYLVQSTQNLQGTVPMVPHRAALLRVFVTANTSNNTQPELEVKLYQGTQLYRSERIRAPRSSVPLVRDESDLNNSWNLLLGDQDLQPGLSLQIEVNPNRELSESDFSNNRFPGVGQPWAIPFMVVPTYRVSLFPVQTGDGRVGNLDPSHLEEYTHLLERSFPVTAIDKQAGGIFVSSTILQSNGSGWTTLLHELDAKRVAEGSSRLYYGVVNRSYTGGIGGVAYGGKPTAIGLDRHVPSNDQWDRSGVFAHEAGHTVGLGHTSCGGAGGTGFPYPGGCIGVWGLDLSTLTLKPPTSTFDLMGYCNNMWISDFNYLQILGFMNQQGPSTKVSEKAPCLLVWGSQERSSFTLEPAFSLDLPRLPIPAGDQRLRLLDAQGQCLKEVSFQLHPVAEHPGSAGFAFALPLDSIDPSDIASTVWIQGERVLASRSRTPARVSKQPALRLERGQWLWDQDLYPALLLRDPHTQEVRAILRHGRAPAPAFLHQQEIHGSDGLSSHRLALEAETP